MTDLSENLADGKDSMRSTAESPTAAGNNNNNNRHPMIVDTSNAVQCDDESSASVGCCLPNGRAFKATTFILDIISFVYALYAAALFFVVVLMWVFSVLITIYVSISSGNRWAQLYALALGIPAIGPIVNVLDESFVLLVRTLRHGFHATHRPFNFSLLILPSAFPDSAARSDEWALEHGIGRVEAVLAAVSSGIANLPPAHLSPQRKLAALFIVLDFIFLMLFAASNFTGGFVVRAWIALFAMLVCSSVRFVRNAPYSFEDLQNRVTLSRSMRFVKYVSAGACCFILLSTTASAGFSKRHSVYDFTLGAFFAFIVVVAAILFIVLIILPLCPALVNRVRYGPFSGKEFSDLNVTATPPPRETDGGSAPANGSSSARNSDAFLTARDKAFIIIGIVTIVFSAFFLTMFFGRASGAGGIDSTTVTAGHRVGALIVWVLAVTCAGLHGIGDPDLDDSGERLREFHSATPSPKHATAESTTQNGGTGNGAPCLPKREATGTSSAVSMHSLRQDTDDVAAEHQVSGATGVEGKKLGKGTPQKTTKNAARILIGIITAVFFVVVGLLTCLNNPTSNPALSKQFDTSVLAQQKEAYSLCSAHYMAGDRFNATDLVLIAKSAYYADETAVGQALRNWFDTPVNVSGDQFGALRGAGADNTSNAEGVRAYHVVFPATSRTLAASLPANIEPRPYQRTTTVDLPRVDVVAVRGSHTGLDWLQDGYVWGDSLFFSFFERMSPFSLPNSVIASLVKWSKWLRYGVFGDISYFTELRIFTDQVQSVAKAANSSGILIVGHSLGGGLAQLIGAAMQIEAFAVSGVGMGYQAAAANFDVDTIRSYLTNIAPASDPVPQIDLQVGDVQNIACNKAPNPLGCHSITTTYMELQRSCKDIRDTRDLKGTSTNAAGEAAAQVIIWIITLLLLGGAFHFRAGALMEKIRHLPCLTCVSRFEKN